MQNEISVKPLVDILSDITGKRVVMRYEEYVLFEYSTIVEQKYISQAKQTQKELQVKEKKELEFKKWKSEQEQEELKKEMKMFEDSVSRNVSKKL